MKIFEDIDRFTIDGFQRHLWMFVVTLIVILTGMSLLEVAPDVVSVVRRFFPHF